MFRRGSLVSRLHFNLAYEELDRKLRAPGLELLEGTGHVRSFGLRRIHNYSILKLSHYPER
jgi:hypothetical protein